MNMLQADVLLEPVGAALVNARQALGHLDSLSAPEREAAATKAEDCLVQLACVACDAVVAWDAQADAPEIRDQGSVSKRVTRWRGQFDDLRVQAALAEMDVRASSQHTLAAVEQSASVVEKLIVERLHEVASALGAFRAALKPHG